MNSLLEFDPSFLEANFLSFVDNVFIKLHLALMKGNLDEVRHFISDSIYSEFDNRLKVLNEKNERQIFGEINVKDSKIEECTETEDSFLIKVTLISRYLDYVIDKDSGTKKRGNDSSRKEKTNTLIFERKKDLKKREKSIHCPSCGANMDINNSGKCNYCGQIYKQEDYDWVLQSLVSN